MQRLILAGPAAVRWEEADAPALAEPAGAIVRPVAVATCDLDVAVLAGRYPLPGPYPFGHEAVAEVTEVGSAVTTVAPGDLVIVPFQISCGSCGPCRRGRTGNCASHPRMSTYGLGSMGGLEWGGLLADLAWVPHADAMLVRLPAGLDPLALASASDNIADAWRAVGPQLAAEPGPRYWSSAAKPERGRSACTRPAWPSPLAPPGSPTWTRIQAGWRWQSRSEPTPSRARHRARRDRSPSPWMPAAAMTACAAR